jgi:hypothetical protein
MDTEKKSNGALIGLVIIVVILVIGGIYMWQSSQDTTVNSTISDNQTSSGGVTAEDVANLDTLDADINSADTSIDANTVDSVN